MTFKEFLIEKETVSPKLPFDKTVHQPWHQDGEHMIVYHGTHEKNVSSMKREGINRPDPKTGMFSVTHDPHTAHAYAAMSGGEAHFRSSSKATTTPHNNRAVLKIKIPMHWAKEHMDHNMSGNIGAEDHTNDLKDARTRMTSKDEYHRWTKKNPEKSTHTYYSGTEVRFKKAIPSEYIVGHMKKYDS